MKLTAYITRELVPPLLAGTLLFVAVLSFGYFFISSQFLGGVPAGLIVRWIAYQMPDTLVKVLPMGVVLMVVVAFGRLANERELVAVQSGGIGLGRIARPVAVIAGLVALLAVWLSLWVAPRANVETRGLYWDTLTRSGLSQLVGKQVDLGAGLSLYLGGYDAGRRQLQGVRVERWNRDD
ncbi:LptF/LptG family permease, partial [Deinococcus sp.]|uniref:LptF/LptG family permease n=1 Tax=Deinococcus sp. TaxID=47478 RepID=UPI00286E859A